MRENGKRFTAGTARLLPGRNVWSFQRVLWLWCVLITGRRVCHPINTSSCTGNDHNTRKSWVTSKRLIKSCNCYFWPLGGTVFHNPNVSFYGANWEDILFFFFPMSQYHHKVPLRLPRFTKINEIFNWIFIFSWWHAVRNAPPVKLPNLFYKQTMYVPTTEDVSFFANVSMKWAYGGPSLWLRSSSGSTLDLICPYSVRCLSDFLSCVCERYDSENAFARIS